MRMNSDWITTGRARAASVRFLRIRSNGTLLRETCGWLSQPIVNFFAESVQHAVLVEFDRYIEAGDLSKTEERMHRLAEENELGQGFVGMYL